jgi:hypothetical protein
MYKQNAGRAHQIDLLHRIALWPVREQWLLCCSWNGVYLNFVFASLFQFPNLFKKFIFYLHHFGFLRMNTGKGDEIAVGCEDSCAYLIDMKTLVFIFLKYYYRR